jgi:clan AA aspartic protease (TIGR02281 family)
MKVITIGRDTDNDVVVNDSKVSRHHAQIISDGGSFRIVDFNTTNGTFVNDSKVSGETALRTNDVVRIGNTVLPWQTYFKERKTKKNQFLLYAGIAGAVAILAVICFVFFHYSQETGIKMTEKNGVRYIPMKINGQELNFVFDTGASSICISTFEASLLAKNGLLSVDDVIGQQAFTDATGWISVGVRINLKTVQIGNKVLENVEATVIENPNAECLLGQTVLSRFGEYTIDNKNNVIIFK